MKQIDTKSSPPTIAPDRLLDKNELADLLGCSNMQVHRLYRQGRIPHVRVGRLVRFERDPVMRALRETEDGKAALSVKSGGRRRSRVRK